jgi:ATP-binding cassette subfamily B protein
MKKYGDEQTPVDRQAVENGGAGNSAAAGDHSGLSAPRLLKGLNDLIGPELRAERAKIIGGVCAMILASSMMLGMGWGLRLIVDSGFAGGSDGSFLNNALLTLLAVILVMAAASYTRVRLIYAVAEKVIMRLRQRIYAHLLTLDAAFFDTQRSADLVSRINTDTSILQIVITSNLPSVFRHSMMMLGGVVMLCVVSPPMTGIVLAAVPVVVGPIVFFGRRVRKKSRAAQDMTGDLSVFAEETLHGVQTVQSFGFESMAGHVFNQKSRDVYNQSMQYVHIRAFLTAFVIATVLCAIGLILWHGGHKVLSGQMSAGDLSAFIFYSAMVAGGLMALSEAAGEFARARGAADRVMSILNTRPMIMRGAALFSTGGAVPFSGRSAGTVTFENVTFRYPSRHQVTALSDVSFTIHAGQVAAFVGPSGSGKTTIFQLMQRFYDPERGTIAIDGVDYKDINPADLRSRMGVVSQDPALFSMSIMDNIRIARPGATEQDAIAAAKMADAHDFIMDLPQGYDTILGQRGAGLSGGQRQRLAIARVILKDPAILLLDEATSALDAASEHAVQEAIKMLMQGRTTILISHRLSAVRHADVIFVMDRGRIVDCGQHSDLFGKNSLYTYLSSLQAA